VSWLFRGVFGVSRCNSIVVCDFSIGHGGIGDIDKHIRTAKHAAQVESCDPAMCKIQHFFTKGKDLCDAGGGFVY